MQRRGLTYKDVARMTGLNERTIQRFCTRETFDLRTLDRVEAALRLVSPVGTTTDSDAQKRPETPRAQRSGPIVGWRQAAIAVGVSRETLRVRRCEAGDTTRWPWWRSEEACRQWYQRMIGEVE